MKFLAIDTGAKKLTVAAKNGEEEVALSLDCAMQHSVRLFETIEEVLSRARLTLAELDFIACVVGPGSFTGIRIGISAVKGLCFAAEKPALVVTSFEEIAYDGEGKRIAVVDAGHGYVYAEGFGVELTAGYYPFEEVAAYALAAGARLLSAEYEGMGVEKTDAARGLLRAAEAKSGECASSEMLAALYLRRSAAEEGR